MAETVPAIRVTDPQDNDAHALSASPAQSPMKNTFVKSDGPSSRMEPNNSPDSPKLSSSGNHASERTSRNSSSVSQNPPLRIDPSSTSANMPRSPLDPLSLHIMKRQSPGSSGKTQKPPANSPDTLRLVPTTDSNSGKSSAEIANRESPNAMSPPPKKKGVSFFSRIIGNKKKDEVDLVPDSDGEKSESRPEGADAELFYDGIDNLSFNPTYPRPPAYIKVHAHSKKKKEFDRVFLAQVLNDLQTWPGQLQRSQTSGSTSRLKRNKTDENDALWALEFSRDGKYLAAGGQDKAVRVWATLTSSEERKEHEKEEEAEQHSTGGRNRLSAPVFRDKPFRIYHGHTSPVLDLSWSKNNFLLSSSMDKTVRLWHVSRSECLCAFKHTDFVTSIQFHPKDDRFFLAGSLDSKLRLWSIPDKSVAYWNSVPEMITAVAFTPDGKTAIAGCLNGQCHFYETEGLKYQTQMHVRSARGKNAKGSKITGIQTTTMPPSNLNGEVKLLITSNDSRVRLYNLRDKSLEMKFKGNENTSSQIHARFSDDARYIICGSEDRRVFIWSLGGLDHGDGKERRPVEFFEAHSAATTVCAIAPTRTRQLLSNSEDPLYDLCNPPAVTLVSKSEAESVHSARVMDDTSSLVPTPPVEGSFKRPEESAAYIARSHHPDGNIVVTADAKGCIKVFRQDCAFEKRTLWEPVRKFRRQSSMASSSRSLARQDSGATQAPRDRILSWRQSITSTNSADGISSAKKSPALTGAFSRHQNRSSSPRKSIGNASRPVRASTVGGAATTGAGSPGLGSTPPSLSDAGKTSVETGSSAHAKGGQQTHKQHGGEQVPSPPPFDRADSSTFWRRDAWRVSIMDQIQSSKQKDENTRGGLMVPERKTSQGSAVSALTDETSGPPSPDSGVEN